jgi:hypothetical protein
MATATKRKPAPTPRDLRDTLFGDAPMEAWPPKDIDGQPWDLFVRARNAAAAGRTADAIKAWQRIVGMPDLESRHYIQAWQFLREAGVQPSPTQAKELLGVVIEVPREGGLDLLAAYPDRHARYYNYSGAGVVWEHPSDSLDGPIDAVLTAATQILRVIGPWDKPRPAAPRTGNLRINLLSAAGLHFGEGPFGALASDPLAKPTMDSAVALMQALVALNGE